MDVEQKPELKCVYIDDAPLVFRWNHPAYKALYKLRYAIDVNYPLEIVICAYDTEFRGATITIKAYKHPIAAICEAACRFVKNDADACGYACEKVIEAYIHEATARAIRRITTVLAKHGVDYSVEIESEGFPIRAAKINIKP